MVGETWTAKDGGTQNNTEHARDTPLLVTSAICSIKKGV